MTYIQATLKARIAFLCKPPEEDLISNVKLRYVSYEFPEFDIHLRTLKDKQQFSDDEQVSEKVGINSTLWSIFGVVWDSGQVMAHLMSTYDIENKRILEVGCGIGLSSLVLNERNADITATDYHPEAKVFLEKNVELNKAKKINFEICDWKNEYPDLGKFDLIIGSDLLYQADHAEILASFINNHSKDGGEVIHIAPNRGHQGKFNRKMEDYSFSHEKMDSIPTEYLSEPYKGHIHKFKNLSQSLSK